MVNRHFNKFLILVTLIVLASLMVQADPTQNLRAHWTFDPDTTDQTGNGFNGISTGSTVDCTVAGETGQGCLVSNQGDFLYANMPLQLSEPNGFAAATWVNFDTVGEKILTAVGHDFQISYFNNNVLRCHLVDAPGTYNHASEYSFVPQVGQWYHVACSFDPADNSLRLYRDGVQVAVSTVSFSSFPSYNANRWLGLSCDNIWWCPAGPNFGEVRYDDVRVYNSALTATDVSIIHSGGAAPVCGNSVVEAGEVCDGGSQACSISGYSGSQNCNSQCTGYDVCTTTESCGDSIINGPEVCDGNTQSCTTAGGYSGSQTCAAQCDVFNTCTSPDSCGDGVINGPELCDDGGLNGQPNQCNSQCTGTTGAVCGNTIIELGEVCDSNSQSCTINGYSGTQDCTAQCDAFNTCSSPDSCGDGVINGPETCDDGASNGQVGFCNNQCDGIVVSATCGDGVLDAGETCDDGANNGQQNFCNAQCTDLTLPVYSNGGNVNCPAFVSGSNTNFVSGGYTDRRFVLDLPANPQGAPVIFAWHYLGGNEFTIAGDLGLTSLVSSDNVIIVSPGASGGAQYEWFAGTPPPNNPDLDLFDDVVACLYQNYNVDLDRIYSTGFSAGGAWTSYLGMYRANRLAANVVYSGGLQTPVDYQTPASAIPTLLAWGGVTDTYFEQGANFAYNNGDPQTFSFHESSLDFSSKLRQDSSFVVECQDTYGHATPPSPVSYSWQFFQDHPNNITTEPYAAGLPAGLPATCLIPVNAVCGNGIVEGSEVCDGGSQVCSVGGYSGNQPCNAQCTGYDICASSESCGDGVVNGPETCDDGGLNGQPNQCNSQCDGTTAAVCGNSVVEAGEVCDGNSQSCTTNGYSGSQACTAQCDAFNTCTTTEFCGDGVINGVEVCDDGAVNSYPGSCNLICTGSLTSTCGNGVQEAGEVCW